MGVPGLHVLKQKHKSYVNLKRGGGSKRGSNGNCENGLNSQTQRFQKRMWGQGEICPYVFAQFIVFVYFVSYQRSKKKKKRVYGIIFGLGSSVAGSQVHFTHCACFWEFPGRSRKPRSRAAMIHWMTEWKDKVK